MENTYWTANGTYEAALVKLHALIDEELKAGCGECGKDKPQLERLRKAKNAYYRLYNDGDVTSATYTYFKEPNDKEVVEAHFDKIILSAIVENFVAS